MHLDIKSDIHGESALHVLKILNPMIKQQYEIARKNQLIDGIKELVSGEEDTSFLSPTYKEILKNADDIR